MHLIDCLYHVSFGRYRPLKLPLSCKVVEKRWFLDPDLLGKVNDKCIYRTAESLGPGLRADTIYMSKFETFISVMHFQTALTSEHVTGFG